MKTSRLVLVVALGILFGAPAFAADFKLASVFSDGMVIQRDQPVPVWGTSAPNAQITVQLGEKSAMGTADGEGHWKVMVDPAPVGGPYTLKASSDANSVTVQDVLSGDVWLCSGQSNMQFGTGEAIGGAQAVADSAQYTNLRLLEVGRGGSNTPSTTFGGKWKHSAPESVKGFAAVGYFFALDLMKDPAMANVPIGLVNSSFGGTAIEGWIPSEGLADAQPNQFSASMFNLGKSTLFNGMIAPLAPMGLKGVIWYQGEANAGKPEFYEHFLSTLITQWRQLFGAPNLPFIIVQLPPFSGKFGGKYYTGLREAQAGAAATVPNTYVAITLGTTDGSNLHPKQKQPVGARVALLARKNVYGEKIVAQGPIEKSVDVQGGVMRVKFDTGGEALVSQGGDELNGFLIAGDDGVYQGAKATIDGDTVVLQSEAVPNPKTVRYAYAGVPESDLYNTDGLPAAPFRTDTLPIKDIEFDKDPISRTLNGSKYSLTVSGAGRVTSFEMGGHQIMSNGLGSANGTNVGGPFGPLDFPGIRDLGPGHISCTGSDITLEITCDDDGVQWHITNKGGKGIEFKVGLAPWITATQQTDEIDLAVGNATIKLEATGELSTPKPEGSILTIKVGPRADALMKFSMAAK